MVAFDSNRQTERLGTMAWQRIGTLAGRVIRQIEDAARERGRNPGAAEREELQEAVSAEADPPTEGSAGCEGEETPRTRPAGGRRRPFAVIVGAGCERATSPSRAGRRRPGARSHLVLLEGGRVHGASTRSALTAF